MRGLRGGRIGACATRSFSRVLARAHNEEPPALLDSGPLHFEER